MTSLLIDTSRRPQNVDPGVEVLNILNIKPIVVDYLQSPLYKQGSQRQKPSSKKPSKPFVQRQKFPVKRKSSKTAT